MEALVIALLVAIVAQNILAIYLFKKYLFKPESSEGQAKELTPPARVKGKPKFSKRPVKYHDEEWEFMKETKG